MIPPVLVGGVIIVPGVLDVGGVAPFVTGVVVPVFVGVAAAQSAGNYSHRSACNTLYLSLLLATWSRSAILESVIPPYPWACLPCHRVMSS